MRFIIALALCLAVASTAQAVKHTGPTDGAVYSYNNSYGKPVTVVKEGPHGTFTGPVIGVRSEYDLRFEDGCVKFTRTMWTLRYTVTYEWGVKTNSEEVWSEGATVTVVEFCQ